MSPKPSLWQRALSRLGLSSSSAAPARRRGAFAGAVANRLTLDWILTPITSADKEQQGDLRSLRARARELSRNSAVGNRFCALLEQNVIGSGIRLQAKNLTSEGTLYSAANAKIEAAWEDFWGTPGLCTLDGHLTGVDLQCLSVRTMGTDGEFLAEIIEGPAAGNGWGFALNLLDADLLDESFSRKASVQANEVRQSIESDEFGRPVAYWLWTRHPGDDGSMAQRTRRRVPADRIVHLFLARRPRQSRGVTWFAPVMMDVRMLAGYYEAELVAARVASAKMGFIKVDPEIGGVNDSTTPGAGQQQVMDADPGSFWYGNPGEELQVFNPEHPVAAFRDFTVAILHHIASGLGISYGTLTGDLSQANYSSMRVGQLVEREFWRRVQQLVISHLLQRCYRIWLRQALLNQKIAGLDSLETARWHRVSWQARGFPWVDPLKEIQAAGEELALGLTTRTALSAERGRDFEETLESLKEENQLIADYGVPIQTPTLGANATDGVPADAPPPDEGGAQAKAADRGEHDDDSQLADRIVARVLPALVAMQPKTLAVTLAADGVIPAPVIHVAPAAAPDVTILPPEPVRGARTMTLQRDPAGRVTGATLIEDQR